MKNTGSLNLTKSKKGSFDNVISTIFKELPFPENAYTNESSKEPAWKCRYVVTIIGFLVILTASIHRSIMSVVIVAMVNNTAVIQNLKEKSVSCPDLLANSTDDATLLRSRTEGEFIWSPETQGLILACFFFGQVFTFIPAGRLAERFGCKWILVGSLITTSILTMMIPPFSRLSATALIVIQTLRGFAQGIPEPCIYILMANWLPKTERGCLFSLILSANSLGPALGNIFAGYVSESPLGWPYTFYTVGCSGLALAGYICLFIAESPKEHSRITKAELYFILSQQETKLSRKRPKLPWRQMLTCIPLYAYIIGQFGRCWKFSQFWSVNSTFLGTILHYPIGQNGLFSAIPFLLSFMTSSIASLITGYIEKKKVVSIDFLRKFWIFTAGLIYSLCVLGMYISGCNRDLSVIFSVLSLGLSGLGTAAVVALQDMSPTFSGTLASIAATVGYMAGALLPLMVGKLTNEMQTLEQWNKVFFISIGIVMTSATIFVIFGSTKIQPWNFVEEEEEDKKKEKRKPENNENNEKVEMTRF